MDTQVPKKSFFKSKKFLYLVGIIFIIYIVGSGISNVSERAQNPTPSTPTSTASAPQPNTADKEKAKSDLSDFMKTAAKANLVTSYEFSDKATVVYVDSGWYDQPVTFKKDFMAKVASYKQIITGFKHFEMRDAYSDAKVAEVTAFSSSLEVYR